MLDDADADADADVENVDDAVKDATPFFWDLGQSSMEALALDGSDSEPHSGAGVSRSLVDLIDRGDCVGAEEEECARFTLSFQCAHTQYFP